MENTLKPYSKYVQKLSLKVEKCEHYMPRSRMNNSIDIATAVKQLNDWHGNNIQEHFYVLYLNKSNKLLGFTLASIGGITGTVADIRLIIQAALSCGAVFMIISHNHPSGNLKPSKADEELTKKIKEASKLFDINLVDHVIISEEGHYSFSDEGLL